MFLTGIPAKSIYLRTESVFEFAFLNRKLLFMLTFVLKISQSAIRSLIWLQKIRFWKY
jgi:hypothetical protein